jgi:hypothetical protein
MLIEKIGYSYNDVTLVPETISNVSSRSDCNPFIKDKFLPIFTAPMASVVNFENYETFLDNGIIPIIPRNISLEVRKDLMNDQQWVALSLKEFEDLFINNYLDRIGDFRTHYFICVDIANGHMKSLYDKCVKAKNLAKDNSYRLTIMTGNIANAETYRWICDLNYTANASIIDFIRVGIGGGSGCFIDGTKIKTINGEKNIEDINIGDKVLTIDNTYQDVIDKTRFKSNELIKINNEITSTINHKFFVINKSDKDKVNEQNLEKYGYWIEANKLNKNKHLLIKYE